MGTIQFLRPRYRTPQHVHLLVVAQSGRTLVCVDHAACDSPWLIPQRQGTGREKIDPCVRHFNRSHNHSSGQRLPDSVPLIDFPPDFPLSGTIRTAMTKFSVVLLVLLLILLGIPFAILLLLSSHSVLTFTPPPKLIGIATPVTVRISNPHGARRITAILEEDGAQTTLKVASNVSTHLSFWRAQKPDQNFQFTAGQET